MKYRYEHRTDVTEFAVLLSFKNEDLREDIDKTYYEDEGKIFIQPLVRTEQNEIIEAFQNVAYKVYKKLLNEQAKETSK